MLGWLKKKLDALEHIGEHHYKLHYRLLSSAERDIINKTCKVQWCRGHTKKGYYFDASATQSQIKQVTGKTAVFLGGTWYEVTYESNSL